MEKISDKELEQRIEDLIALIWTPDNIVKGKAKREKQARDKSLELIENNKIEKEYKL